MTHTLTVSIGRNVPGYPEGEGKLDDSAWSDFRAKLAGRVAFWIAREGQIVFTGSGIGRWTDPETDRTDTEDAHTIVALTDTLEWISGLRSDLRSLASAYQQTAIALTIGSTDLVPAHEGEPF